MENNSNKKNIFQKFDSLIETFIPSFNARAILYFTFILALAIFVQVWGISNKNPQRNNSSSETTLADDNYWNSQSYKDRIKNQTVNSFNNELTQWLDDKDNEFIKRRFDDILYINNSLTPETGGDLTTLVPESFNYFETIAKARFLYAEKNGFLNEQSNLISFGNLFCNVDEKTQKDTGIELFDYRYASMQKLAKFMTTKPDWKMQIGQNIYDISDPNIEDKDLINLKTAQTQPVGLFSFLIFHEPKTNKIFLADTQILENNGIDSKLTLARLTSHLDKQPTIYFKYGFDGCKQITNFSPVNYGQSN